MHCEDGSVFMESNIPWEDSGLELNMLSLSQHSCLLPALLFAILLNSSHTVG